MTVKLLNPLNYKKLYYAIFMKLRYVNDILILWIYGNNI